MADKSQQLVLEALQRAAAEPGGLPLFASRKSPGLFAANAAGKKAAQLCQDNGYLANQENGVSSCTLSNKGLAFLFEQVQPRPVLEAFVRAIEARGVQVDGLLVAVQQTRQALDALKNLAGQALTHLPEPGMHAPAKVNGHAMPPKEGLDRVLLSQLGAWKALEDCPLPELFRQARQTRPDTTVGTFHDALRELQSRREIYLHPWTGPLYQLPEPAFALLIGHEVAYYASAV